jgi:hypothetical protein
MNVKGLNQVKYGSVKSYFAHIIYLPFFVTQTRILKQYFYGNTTKHAVKFRNSRVLSSNLGSETDNHD